MTPYINVGQSNIPMSGKEFLQVHIDCMNSVGEIITIDDVDDLGGSVSGCIYTKFTISFVIY